MLYGQEMRALALVILLGCSSTPSSPDASTAFEYQANARWSPQATPDVVSVTIDGRNVASSETYTVDEMFASYADAVATFAPHPVVVVTTTQTLTFKLDMLRWPCSSWMVDAPVTKQTDQYSVSQGVQGSAGALDFGAYTGSCESSDGQMIGWAERPQ